MPRAVVFGDLHLEAGSHLGWPDSDYGSTRIRDAIPVLEQISQTPCDVLIFLGDAGRTARLKPTSYRLLQDALGSSKSKFRVLLMGNHDFTNESACALDVIANSIDNAIMVSKPQIVKAGGIQIGGLPWVPPSRVFSEVPNNPREMNHALREKLLAFMRGMGAKLDPGMPSLLVGHWLISGSELPVDAKLLEINEPILPTPEFRGCGGWDFMVFGHNHVHAKVTPTVWVAGAPMRTSFGEEGHPTGYVMADWGGAEPFTAQYVLTGDRSMRTITFDAGWNPAELDALDGAVVRLRATTDEDGARIIAQDSRRIVEAVYAAGASKVVGPQVTVKREERPRSGLSSEMTPEEALGRWLDSRKIPQDQRDLVAAEARSIMEDADGTN